MTGPTREVCRLVVLAKAPVPGQVKTRLAATLGDAAAADIARRLLDHALRQALAAGVGPVRLCGSPDPQHPAFGSWGCDPALERRSQAAGGLGERMSAALRAAADEPVSGGQGASAPAAPPDAVLLLGSDAPALDAGRLRLAAAALVERPVVLVPAWDGGYAAVGLRTRGPWTRPTDMASAEALDREGLLAALFSDIPWSRPDTLQATRLQLSAACVDWQELEPVGDIDTADDLARGLPEGV